MKLTLAPSLFLALTLPFAFGAPPLPITNTQTDQHPVTKVQVVAGELTLPLGLDWYVEEPLPAGLGSAMLVVPDAVANQLSGVRMQAVEKEKALRENRRALSGIFYYLRKFALEHEGVSPTRVLSLDAKAVAFLEKHGRLETFFLIPNRRIFTDTVERTVAKVQPLAFELMPAADDGQHWVLLTNGATERRPLDLALFQKHQQQLIKPRARVRTTTTDMKVQILASRHADAADDITLRLRRWGTDEQLQARWAFPKHMTRQAGLVKKWARERYWNLSGQSEPGSESLLLDHWRRHLNQVYGLEIRPERPRRNRELTNAMGVLGGRAAIRETLQLQAIETRQAHEDSAELFAIESIRGVQVDAHPFEEMLGGEAGGHLALADFAPIDRFFLYFGAPKDMGAFLESGSPVLQQTGLNITGRQLNYGLSAKYLDRFGLDEEGLQALLDSGAIAEMAIIMPDLFVIDGTELSCVARLANPALAKAAFKLLGISLTADAPTLVGKGPQQASWQLLADDILLVSTHAKEAQYITTIAGSPQSLGASFEMKFMLKEVPVDEKTLLYAYFSDPFIRRLVGPEVKIGQYRRLRARSELEGLSAMALLREIQHGTPSDLAGLEQGGYVTAARQVSDRRLDAQYLASSPTYGEPGDLRSLLDLDLERVTLEERQAYEAYRENYTRYWRRFFDPIGIRINREGDKQFSAETLILPLLDHSMYNQLREMLVKTETDRIDIPALNPAPVAMTSLQLSEAFWIDVLHEWIGEMGSEIGWSASLFDHFGPDVHIALADADPIIALGGGDIGGLFGVMDGSSDMFSISAVVSMLTRPTSILIGLDDPEAVKKELLRLPSRIVQDGGSAWTSSTFYRITGTERFVLELDLEGLFRLRFGVQVDGRYLHITNQPLSHRPKVTGTNKSLLGAAQLAVHPAACLKQLPALHASAVGRERAAAMAGMDYLYPLVGPLAPTIEEAQSRHRSLFGFAPSHPDGGNWVLENGFLTSDRFGSLGLQQQPEMGEEGFGAMKDVDSLQLAIQFEHDGLRSRIVWEKKTAR